MTKNKMKDPEAKETPKPLTRIRDYVITGIICFWVFSGFLWIHTRRTKNMTDFKDLQAMAGEMYDTEDVKTWLFNHTRSEEEYHQIRRMLKHMASWKPVEWQGATGARTAKEVEA